MLKLGMREKQIIESDSQPGEAQVLQWRCRSNSDSSACLEVRNQKYPSNQRGPKSLRGFLGQRREKNKKARRFGIRRSPASNLSRFPARWNKHSIAENIKKIATEPLISDRVFSDAGWFLISPDWRPPGTMVCCSLRSSTPVILNWGSAQLFLGFRRYFPDSSF